MRRTHYTSVASHDANHCATQSHSTYLLKRSQTKRFASHWHKTLVSLDGPLVYPVWGVDGEFSLDDDRWRHKTRDTTSHSQPISVSQQNRPLVRDITETVLDNILTVFIIHLGYIIIIIIITSLYCNCRQTLQRIHIISAMQGSTYTPFSTVM